MCAKPQIILSEQGDLTKRIIAGWGIAGDWIGQGLSVVRPKQGA